MERSGFTSGYSWCFEDGEELMRDWGSFAAVEKRDWRCLLREIGPQMGLGCEWSRVLEGALAALLYSVLASGLSLHMRC